MGDPMSSSDEDNNDEESHRVLSTHQKPLGKHILLWGKAGQRFPKGCLLGPDWPCLLVSFFLIWGTTLSVIIGIPGSISPWFTLAGFASLFLTTFALCGAAFSDPGIIPKKERTANNTTNLPATDPSTSRTLCSKCLIYRPKGAFHCRDCDACILELDHHCPWTGHCIGENNLMYFQVYLGLLLTHVMIVIALALMLSISAAKMHRQQG